MHQFTMIRVNDPVELDDDCDMHRYMNSLNACVNCVCQLQVETEEVKVSLSEIFQKWAR